MECVLDFDLEVECLEREEGLWDEEVSGRWYIERNLSLVVSLPHPDISYTIYYKT